MKNTCYAAIIALLLFSADTYSQVLSYSAGNRNLRSFPTLNDFINQTNATVDLSVGPGGLDAAGLSVGLDGRYYYYSHTNVVLRIYDSLSDFILDTPSQNFPGGPGAISAAGFSFAPAGSVYSYSAGNLILRQYLTISDFVADDPAMTWTSAGPGMSESGGISFDRDGALYSYSAGNLILRKYDNVQDFVDDDASDVYTSAGPGAINSAGFTFTQIPEPSSLSILVLASACCLIKRRKRAQSQ